MSATELDGLAPGADEPEPALDPYAAELALAAPEPLAAFNRAGVLAAADVRVALALADLAGVAGTEIMLAVALAVRAPRLGHVFVDLEAVRHTVAVDADEAVIAALPWPGPAAWVEAVASVDRLVAAGAAAQDEAVVRPLRLLGPRLYLDRYWREERQLAAALRALAAAPPRRLELAQLAAAVRRLFPDGGEHADPAPRAAAACAALRGLTVIAGGPGTGKTTAVARICALLCEATGEAEVGSAPLIALCAPTGKAAARLQEAVREEADRLELAEPVRDQLHALHASTIHRLLGWRPRAHSRFRHDQANRLPHDVVIVDETSMVSLTLMARLLEAVRPDARLVLVGDPDQLTAIEAGAVLRDIVGPAAAGPQMGTGARVLLERVVGGSLPGSEPAAAGHRPASEPSFGDGIVVLRRGHRFGAAIGTLADAVRRGDGDAAVAAARSAPAEVDWLELDATAGEQAATPLRAEAVRAGIGVLRAARAGDGRAALDALGGFRLLCAHRHGPYGVAAWSAAVERWLADAGGGLVDAGGDYAGRPLLIVRNDYELRLHNGDTGVVVADPGGQLTALFERDGELAGFAPARLEAVETLHAMTIHKSQGSQFDVAAVVLPDPGSRLLTRELLYTAITRARRRLLLVGTEAALRVAVDRPVARATGLRERLWTTTDAPPSTTATERGQYGP